MSEWRGSNRLFNGWTGSRLVGPLPVDRSSVANKPVLLGLLVGQREVTGLLCSLSPAKRRALPEMEKQYDGASMREMRGVKSKINMQNKWNNKSSKNKTQLTDKSNETRSRKVVNQLRRKDIWGGSKNSSFPQPPKRNPTPQMTIRMKKRSRRRLGLMEERNNTWSKRD